MLCSFLQDDGDSEPTLNGDEFDQFDSIPSDTGLGGDHRMEELQVAELLAAEPLPLPVANGTTHCEGEGRVM